MTQQGEIVQFLETNQSARERAHRNKMIAALLQRKYRFLDTVEQSSLADAVGEAVSLNRACQKVMQDNPQLRGTDYDDKEVLEQKAQIALGYTGGYHQDVKKLTNLINEKDN